MAARMAIVARARDLSGIAPNDATFPVARLPDWRLEQIADEMTAEIRERTSAVCHTPSFRRKALRRA